MIFVLLFVVIWAVACYSFVKKGRFSKTIRNSEKGSIVYNICNGKILKHLLPNKGTKFDNKKQTEIHKNFLCSGIGKEAIDIAISKTPTIYEG